MHLKLRILPLLILMSVAFAFTGCGDTASTANPDSKTETVKTDNTDTAKQTEPLIELPLDMGDEPKASSTTLAELMTNLSGRKKCSAEEVDQLVGFINETPEADEVLTAANLVFASRSSEEQVQQVGAALIAHHMAHPAIGSTIVPCSRARGGLKVLDTIQQQLPEGEDKYTAKYWLGYRLGKTSGQALALMKEVAAFETKIPHGDLTLQAHARGFVNAVEKLSVGQLAPEIDGKDADGARFKLSDYRGKVVMLDFWGDW